MRPLPGCVWTNLIGASLNLAASCWRQLCFDSLTRPTLTATYYCGADHQKQHWPTHKQSCKATVGSTTPSGAEPTAGRPQPRGMDERGAPKLNVHPVIGSGADLMSQLEPFAPSIPKEQVYERLIDAYRLWIDDCYVWRRENIGLYAQEDPYPEVSPFNAFRFVSC